jgi:hypothetical protein
MGYIFLMKRKKQPKHVKHLWTQHLFNNGAEHGNNLLHRLHIEEGSGFRISSGQQKMTFRFCSIKLAPGSKRKIQNFAKKFLLQSE